MNSKPKTKRTSARARRGSAPPPLLLALASTVMESYDSKRGASVPEVAAAHETARRLIARAVPLERDEVVAAAQRRGHESCYVKDAMHEVSKDALKLASVGYVEAGLNLGMALMFQLLQGERTRGAK